MGAHGWACDHQKEQLEKVDEYLSKAEPAMAVHKAIEDYSTYEGIPEEIMVMGGLLVGKRVLKCGRR